MTSSDMASGDLAESQRPNTSSDSPQTSVSVSSGSLSDGTHENGSSSSTSESTLETTPDSHDGKNSASESTLETTPDSHDGKKDEILVMPDMFSSIMAVEPIVNPNYFKVKPKGDTWIQWYH